MNTQRTAVVNSRAWLLLLSSILTAVILLIMVQLIAAESGGAPDLSGSTKAVMPTTIQPGGTVSYEIVVRNDGNAPADNVVMTDTIPAAIATYSNIAETTTMGLGSLSLEANNTLVWEGSLLAGGFVIITFDAVLDDTLGDGEMVTNTVQITGSGDLIEKSAVLTMNEVRDLYLPFIFTTLPTVRNVAISDVNADSDFTVSWSPVNISGLTGYEIQEATDGLFNNVVNTYDVGLVTSLTIDGDLSRDNVRFVRVRAKSSGNEVGPWSGSARVINNYRERFFDSLQTWDVRRTDADDDEYNLFRNDDDTLQFELFEDDDYLIVSPLRPTPNIPYRIEAVISGRDLEDRHMYGVVFAADWDGTACPNDDYSSCFTTFYELRVQYRELDGREFYEFKLKRNTTVDDNQPDGETLIDWTEVDVDEEDLNDFIEWQIDVEADGDIKIYVENERFGSVRDAEVLTLNNNGYFGVIALTRENGGSKARLSEFSVTVLDASLMTID